ncbi:MAG: phosphoribosylformylglycinamidine synthase I [Candidatus Thermoplasmatota archaeon]|nr:phosphoribosylformylglycinamidine synthase I [Candidatus Thermoplasmatota archaeon]MCL5731121.1 phosphoribosylformylglycinamidine synthase I [Candidatus Thermoplasmatota archaeon]
MEGTNCEDEAYRGFLAASMLPEFVHVNELDRGTKRLEDYDSLFIPGGFSAGDYIRAGALFAARLERHRRSLEKFADEGKPIIGICNGFQVLTELGFLPGINGNETREASLTLNLSSRFECRDVFLKVERSATGLLNQYTTDEVVLSTVAHSEGRLVFLNEDTAQDVVNKKMVILRYSDMTGGMAGYPWNPNGSYDNIAGISNPSGNVIGMMPHPERKLFQSSGPEGKHVLGKGFFDSIRTYLENV